MDTHARSADKPDDANCVRPHMSFIDSPALAEGSPVSLMSPRTRASLFLIIGLVAVEFTLRGPVRWIIRGNERVTDLTGPYVGARAWVRGLNPYRSDVFWTMSEEVGLGSDRSRPPDDFESHTPYPVTSFVLLAPLTVFGWPTARLVAMLAMTLLVLLAIGALASLTGARGSPSRRYLFLAMALGLAPLHSSIGTGNPVAAALALTILAICAALRGKQTPAGALLALAICLKPPIAIPVVAYYILRGRVRIVAVAVAVMAFVAAIGIGRLFVAGTPWLADYLANNRQLVADHGGAIIEWSPTYAQFINLQYLGWVLFRNTRQAGVLALAVGGTLSLTWLLLLLKRGQQQSELLEVSSLTIISLLPIYHRTYDAAFLLLPLAWVFSEWHALAAWIRRATLVLIAGFLLPGGTVVEGLTLAGRIPEGLAQQWWWYAMIVPHQVWLLLLLSGVLLAAQASARSVESP